MIKRKLKTIFGIFGIEEKDEYMYKIYSSLINLLYQQLSPSILLMEGIVVSTVVFILWNDTDHHLLIGWLFYMLLISEIGRWTIRIVYFKNKNQFSNARSIGWFTTGAVFSAAGWGFLGLFLMPPDNLISQTFVIMVIFGITSVANYNYSTILGMYAIFIILAFFPLSAWLFLQGYPYTFLGAMSFIYVGVMINFAYYTNKLLINSMKLGFDNLELALTEKRLSDQLIIASRHAGMADVATSVLHNIGNVLTSVNTSVGMLSRKISASKISNLEKISELLKARQQDLEIFLSTDPKGKRLPAYLDTLVQSWKADKKYLLEEIDSLNHNVVFIKEVISRQNVLIMATGVEQEIEITELVEDALKLNQLSCEQMNIKVVREFSSVEKIKIDRVKLLQVIVNLIKNSIESLIEANIEYPLLILRIYPENASCFFIEVCDNGSGISPENLKNLFHQGFTTKARGHGFGLHAAALAAEEMHGKLSARSRGVGKGATFTLKLPFEANGK